MLNILSIRNYIKNNITIIKPATLLLWQKQLIANQWTFPHKKVNRGKPETPKEIKQIILRMKNENLLWGSKKIQGELLKLDIKLARSNIATIIETYRKQGKINTGTSWRKFLMLHAKSLYGMDFFTIDTFRKQRFYVYFVIKHDSREIVQYAITKYPVREFVRQNLIDLQIKTHSKIKMIHDNAAAFNLNYESYNIKNIPTSFFAPNMNSIAERFVLSIRKEALDNFILFNEHQIKNIIDEYILYYNTKRPHQGINQKIPSGYSPTKGEKILSMPILEGLHHHYERSDDKSIIEKLDLAIS